MLKEITILISACNSPVIPGGMKFYKNNPERKIRVVGVDMTSDPSAKYVVDAFYKVPPASHPDYCDIILDICKKEKVDIYFPTISAELEPVVKRRKEFEDIGVILSVSDLEAVKIANNKLESYKLLESAGISVPKFYPVKSVNDFVEGMKYMGYPEKPVCIKIVNGSGSRGVRIIDSKKNRYEIFAHEKPNSFYTSYEDMLSILESATELEDMMLVEFMNGPEFTVDLLAEKGRVLYSVGRENIVSIMSIAQESVVKYDPIADDVARKVTELFKFDGNIGFDFMRNEMGEPVLMDINPRTTATLSVIAAAGVDLGYLRIKQLLGEELPKLTPKWGTRLKRRYHEMFTDAEGNLIKI